MVPAQMCPCIDSPPQHVKIETRGHGVCHGAIEAYVLFHF